MDSRNIIGKTLFETEYILAMIEQDVPVNRPNTQHQTTQQTIYIFTGHRCVYYLKFATYYGILFR